MALQEVFRDGSIRTILSGVVPAQVRDYWPSRRLCGAAFMVLASLLLGGGTRGGFLSDATLELLGIPGFFLPVAALLRLPRATSHFQRRAYLVLACCLAMVLLPLGQLVPLPPWIWSR